MEDNATAAGNTAQLPRETVRMGTKMGFSTRVYPNVVGGQCERCGVMDKFQPAEYQYKLCEHYRGMSLECNYCEPTKDQKEVTRISRLHMYDHPFQRDAQGRPAIGVVCDSFACTDAFRKEFGA